MKSEIKHRAVVDRKEEMRKNEYRRTEVNES